MSSLNESKSKLDRSERCSSETDFVQFVMSINPIRLGKSISSVPENARQGAIELEFGQSCQSKQIVGSSWQILTTHHALRWVGANSVFYALLRTVPNSIEQFGLTQVASSENIM